MATKRKASAASIDPYYKQFLDHLLLDHRSHVFRMNSAASTSKYEPNLGHNNTKPEKKKRKKADAEALDPDWAHLLRSDSSMDRYYREYLINLSSRGLDEPKKVVEESRQFISSSSSSVGEFPERGYDEDSFEERLGRCLAEPFNEEEYEELMQEATRRRCRNSCKELRGRSASFATAEQGLSYLDHYWDLGEQIDYAAPHKRLMLLRGFFFWLKNVSHKGAFMPWKDLPSYKGATPVVIHDVSSLRVNI